MSFRHGSKFCPLLNGLWVRTMTNFSHLNPFPCVYALEIPELNGGMGKSPFPAMSQRTPIWFSPFFRHQQPAQHQEKNLWHAALDSCPHRMAPLSIGSIKDGCLKCRYHGWTFSTATWITWITWRRDQNWLVDCLGRVFLGVSKGLYRWSPDFGGFKRHYFWDVVGPNKREMDPCWGIQRW